MMQRMLATNTAPLTDDNSLCIFCRGEDKLLQLLQDIQQARSSIYLQYFIIRNDPTSRILAKELELKANAGVEVKVLYDGLGSMRLQRGLFSRLRQCGGQTAAYAPPWQHLHRLNYRNHRKICVLDGRTGYIGGFNIGDEYASRPERFSNWRDLHLRVEGGSVEALLACFKTDWLAAAGTRASLTALQPALKPGDIALQVVTSGPDTRWQPIKAGMLKMINSARDHIYLETPYFIPDSSLLEAMHMAALSGVQVKVIIPGKPDHPFVLPAGMSFIGELLPAGVRFFFYQPGFLHSKMLTVDGTVSTVGSANFDLRSFCLDYEINAFIYDRRVAAQLETIFLADLLNSTELTPGEYNQRNRWQRTKEAFARRLAPLL